MTQQQINLYQPIFRKERKVFCARTLLQAAAVVLVGLMALYGYASWQTVQLGLQAEQQRAQVQLAQGRLSTLSERYAKHTPSPALERQVAHLAAERNAKLDVLAHLDRGEIGNRRGFSTYLEGLARRHLPKLWLTGFQALDGGARLTLSGSAIEPASVPRYLQRLAEEPAFSGREFRTLSMSRPPDQGWHIDFMVATAEEGTP